jgi:hypothetical protein
VGLEGGRTRWDWDNSLATPFSWDYGLARDYGLANPLGIFHPAHHGTDPRGGRPPQKIWTIGASPLTTIYVSLVTAVLPVSRGNLKFSQEGYQCAGASQGSDTARMHRGPTGLGLEAAGYTWTRQVLMGPAKGLES